MSMTLFTADTEIAHRRASLVASARAANAGRTRGRRGWRLRRARRGPDVPALPRPRDAADDRPGAAVPA